MSFPRCAPGLLRGSVIRPETTPVMAVSLAGRGCGLLARPSLAALETGDPDGETRMVRPDSRYRVSGGA